MPSSSLEPETPTFKPWNSPNLLTHQFILLIKLIDELNVKSSSNPADTNSENRKILELKIINAFSHQLMPSWFAVAKSYYPFYRKDENDNAVIKVLEQKLNIKVSNYESLTVLIRKVFLAELPKVNKSYLSFIDNIEAAIAKLTAIALSTPALINNAHQRNKNQFEGAAASMSSCISPIETILRQIINRAEVDKPIIICATSLLVQVKAIKSHFEQLTLMQHIEIVEKENKALRWSHDEQLALNKVHQLQKRVNQYYNHLEEALTKSPKDTKISTKLELITTMKTDLEKEDVFPSQKIKVFERQLQEAEEQLKKHRDPMWIICIRDCLRILGLTVSGIAIYRSLAGQQLNFFKPSHGQQFVEESKDITISPQETMYSSWAQ